MCYHIFLKYKGVNISMISIEVNERENRLNIRDYFSKKPVGYEIEVHYWTYVLDSDDYNVYEERYIPSTEELQQLIALHIEFMHENNQIPHYQLSGVLHLNKVSDVLWRMNGDSKSVIIKVMPVECLVRIDGFKPTISSYNALQFTFGADNVRFYENEVDLREVFEENIGYDTLMEKWEGFILGETYDPDHVTGILTVTDKQGEESIWITKVPFPQYYQNAMFIKVYDPKWKK